MKYDFDKLIDRRGTSTYKHEFSQYYFGSDDILPLWVADMDFETPDFIMDEVIKRANHRVLGYTVPSRTMNNIIAEWIERNHNWKIHTSWIKFMSGVLPSIAVALQTFSSEGDNVIIQSPIYPPFISIPKANKRNVVFNQLKRVGNSYEMDLDDFRKKAKKGASVFIMSNPHNPAGIVWERETLKEVAEICHAYNILVISDEIHCDLVHPGHEHIPFATVSKKAREISITLMAPSKTFNIAGLGVSFCVVPDLKLRKKFYDALNALHIAHSNMFAYIGLMEAFKNGDDWLKQLKIYLRGNFALALDYINRNIPLVKPFDAKASFLLWLDFTDMGLNSKDLRKLMIEEGKIGMNNGADFGPGGEGFQRLNVGAPRTVIEDALRRIEKAVNNRGL
ncbi:MalY/PatB family protein [Saccharicrinis sp. FJH62]|uniref:MalY/PatB family protein n=1 Tax=Saccharicrinis sp. FJH62 TaxID=3344657 RepID=UPI0035D46C15